MKYTHKVKVEEDFTFQETSTLQVTDLSWPNVCIKILLLNYVTCRNGNIQYSQSWPYRFIQICPSGKSNQSSFYEQEDTERTYNA
jgi:hypothetical protein